MRNVLWQQVEGSLPRLWRVVRSYEANPSLQQDLLQEIMLAIWESLPTLRDTNRLQSFVLRIAHNLGATHVTRSMRTRGHISIDDEDRPIRISSPDDATSRSAQLLDAVRRLPLPLKQVISLQLEGLSYQEIADVLGIDASNVGVRAHRAKKALQELFDESR